MAHIFFLNYQTNKLKNDESCELSNQRAINVSRQTNIASWNYDSNLTSENKDLMVSMIESLIMSHY